MYESTFVIKVYSFTGNGSITIPLQDKRVNESEVLAELLKYVVPPGEKRPCLFHIDVAHEVSIILSKKLRFCAEGINRIQYTRTLTRKLTL